MIRVRFTTTTEQTIDFPDEVKIQNGDGMVQIKNPQTNEIILQCPIANTFILRGSNPDVPMPAPGPDVPTSMQGSPGPDGVQP